MTKLPARGFGVAKNHKTAPAPKKQAMSGMPMMGGAMPAAPRPALKHKVAMAPAGTKMAPNMAKSTLAHMDRTRAKKVATGGPSVMNPGGMQGYPSAPAA